MTFSNGYPRGLANGRLGNKSCKGDKFLSNNFLIWCHFKFPNPVKLLATEEKSISTALLQPGNRRVGLHRFGPAQRRNLKTWITQPACNRTGWPSTLLGKKQAAHLTAVSFCAVPTNKFAMLGGSWRCFIVLQYFLSTQLWRASDQNKL